MLHKMPSCATQVGILCMLTSSVATTVVLQTLQQLLKKNDFSFGSGREEGVSAAKPVLILFKTDSEAVEYSFVRKVCAHRTFFYLEMFISQNESRFHLTT
ncbi:MAG: hypothetical protein J6C87_04800 [Bacteroides sp.]|nr:hypothetical protein [Bacteroides sp.]